MVYFHCEKRGIPIEKQHVLVLCTDSGVGMNGSTVTASLQLIGGSGGATAQVGKLWLSQSRFTGLVAASLTSRKTLWMRTGCKTTYLCVLCLSISVCVVWPLELPGKYVLP